MGCGPCNSRKALMPSMTSLESGFLKSVSLTNSQAANLSFSNNPNMQSLIEYSNSGDSDPERHSERSLKSLEGVSASKEFQTIIMNTNDHLENLLQKEYKIFVWTKNRTLLRELFPDRDFCENIEPSGINVHFLVHTSKAPIITDCVVYLIEKKDDFKEVYRVNQLYKHVWIQVAFFSFASKDLEELSNAFGFKVVKNLKQLTQKIYAEDLKLVTMVKELFHKIDTSRTGLLGFNDLCAAVRKIREDVTEDEVRDGLRRIDLNRNGKISFEEFLFWWKKGRQGPLCFSETVLNWAKTVVNNPGTQELLRTMTRNRMMINKNTRKKEVSVFIGEGSDFQNEIFVEIGKGSFREHLLAGINKDLSLFSQEIWVSVVMQVRPLKSNQNFEQFLKKTFERLLDSTLSDYIDGKRIKKSISFNTFFIGNELHLVIILDSNEEYIEPLNKILLAFDEVLSYPTDDNLKLQIKTSESLKSFFHKTHFLKLLGRDSKVTFSLETWSKLLPLLNSYLPIFKSPILSTFLLSKLNSYFSFKTPSDFFESILNFFPKIPTFRSFLTQSVLNFLSSLIGKIENDLKIFARCGSLGGKISLKSSLGK